MEETHSSPSCVWSWYQHVMFTDDEHFEISADTDCFERFSICVKVATMSWSGDL